MTNEQELVEAENEICQLNEIVRKKNALLNAIADICGLPKSTPFDAMPDAIKAKIDSLRPSKEEIHQMITYPKQCGRGL